MLISVILSHFFVYLVVWLGVNGSTTFCALQGLLHLLHLDCQMGLKISAQGHAGVLGRLPTRENLIITQQCSLVLRVQDLQCANLETGSLIHSQRVMHFDNTLTAPFISS